MERSKLKLCKYCDSGKIIKKRMRIIKKGNIQIFKCKDCKERFTANFRFEKMIYYSVLITRALQMYYSGMSVRDIADCFEQEEIEISYREIKKMDSPLFNGFQIFYNFSKKHGGIDGKIPDEMAKIQVDSKNK